MLLGLSIKLIIREIRSGYLTSMLVSLTLAITIVSGISLFTDRLKTYEIDKPTLIISYKPELQKAYKASYPPGEAKEDWQIINELSSTILGNPLFNNKDELLQSMQNHLNNQNIKNFEVTTYNLNDEKILVEDIDYYYSNTIARASKTMSECRYARDNLKKTGTEG